MNKYSVKDTFAVADAAFLEIEAFLLGKKETLAVINVESNKDYRKKNIDLIWVYIKDGKEETRRIEIKGDRYSHTGNVFLETVSNESKNTPGCILYTEADYIFYYFMDSKELLLIPVLMMREWFVDNMDRFTEKRLGTHVNNDVYYTRGRLVPKNVLKNEVPGVISKIILPKAS